MLTIIFKILIINLCQTIQNNVLEIILNKSILTEKILRRRKKEKRREMMRRRVARAR